MESRAEGDLGRACDALQGYSDTQPCITRYLLGTVSAGLGLVLRLSRSTLHTPPATRLGGVVAKYAGVGPKALSAQRWEAHLKPGELLYIAAGWFHEVHMMPFAYALSLFLRYCHTFHTPSPMFTHTVALVSMSLDCASRLFAGLSLLPCLLLN